MSQVCFLWRDGGDCKFGTDCRFLHDEKDETRGSRRKATQICYAFRESKECEYGADCRYSHDLSLAAEAPVTKSAPKAAPKAAAAPKKSAAPAKAAAPAKSAAKAEVKASGSSAPATVNERLACFNWRDSGTCEFGDQCPFMHSGAETRGSRRRDVQVCYTLRDTGSCKFGDDCRFSHDLTSAAATAAPATAPAAATKVCYRFKKDGECNFGDDCKFAHVADTE